MRPPDDSWDGQGWESRPGEGRDFPPCSCARLKGFGSGFVWGLRPAFASTQQPASISRGCVFGSAPVCLANPTDSLGQLTLVLPPSRRERGSDRRSWSALPSGIDSNK